MLIAWTTVADAAAAHHLAASAIEQSLAVCVQIDGPITSHYRWQGRAEVSSEFRLCFKFMPDQQAALRAWLLTAHPYETPEWIVVEAREVGEKYLSWALANSNHLPFHT